MPQYDIETLNANIAEFSAKYKTVTDELEDDNCRGEYLADADAIVADYPEPDGEVRARLGKFCQHIGCWTVVFGNDLEHGIPYYHKALELCPNSWDIHFEYFTTLEEIIPNEKYSTPELIQDAIDCLTFCIDACDTLELKRKHRVDLRYKDLANVYRIAGQDEKADECEKCPRKRRKNLLNRKRNRTFSKGCLPVFSGYLKTENRKENENGTI